MLTLSKFSMMLSSLIRFKQKILERHTGVSPETYLKHRFDGVSSDLSSFIQLNPFFYANSKWSMYLSEI